MKKLLAAICGILILAGCDLTGTDTGTRRDTSRATSNLHKTTFANVPGWRADDVRYAMQAFRNTCRAKVQYSGKIIPDQQLMNEKCQVLPRESADNATVRAWFESHFQPYKVYDDAGKDRGTFTGYFSPVIAASTSRNAKHTEPIMAAPSDQSKYKNVHRKTIVSNKIGTVLYWADPVDVQNMQVQGTGHLQLSDGRQVKLNWGGCNDMQFRGIGEQMQSRGIRPPDGMSTKAVTGYLKTNPKLADELINNNPRYIYFKEAPTHDVIGSLGVPLSKIRSIAVDNSIYTLGLPVFVNTNLSDSSKFQRLMVAQDTGAAIKGWIRADIFFGSGDEAYEYAHGQYASGEFYVLLPKQYEYVKPTW